MALRKKSTPAKTAASNRKKTQISNVMKLDARHPIPIDNNEQAYSLLNNVSYLPFLAPKDRFGQMLLESRLLSNTNNACIRTKKDYCAGAGFQDVKGKKLDQTIVDWFTSMNLKGQPLVKINKKIFEDFFTWGNMPIQLVRFTVGTERKFFVYPQNFLEWRLAKPNEDDIVENAVQSKLFLRQYNGFITREQLAKGLNLPIYNSNKTDRENWKRDSTGAERTLIWYSNEMSGMPYYGLPENIAALIYCMLEYKSARFDYDLLENDLVAATVLALKGSVSPDEARRIAKDLVATYAGDGNRGRTLVVASEEGIEGSDVHKLETEREGSYVQADDKWTQKIIWANNWDATLAGLVSPSTLGKGSGFITKLLENKLNFVIKPLQQDLMDNVWKVIFKLAQEWIPGLAFDQYELEFKNQIDISGLTDVDITPAVTRNEVRKAKGMREDTSSRGKQYLKQASAEIQDKEPTKVKPGQGGQDPNNPNDGGGNV